MKTVFAIAALAVLAAAGPAHHRRGAKACKAVYPTKVDGGEETKTGGDWSKSTDKEDKKKGDDSKTDNDTDTSATMTCPNDGGKTLKAGGSCDCDYQVNCDSKANVPSTAKFWERTSGEIILSLAECVSICDENSECEACIWVDDSTANSYDYHHCWQVSGLGAIESSGYGQISYKGDCSGSCASSYKNVKAQ